MIIANVALQTEKRAFQQSLAPVAQRFTSSARMPARLPVRKESTAVHPVAVLIPFAACASFFPAVWIGFAADREAAVFCLHGGRCQPDVDGPVGRRRLVLPRRDIGWLHRSDVQSLHQRGRGHRDRQDHRPRSSDPDRRDAGHPLDRRHDHYSLRSTLWCWGITTRGLPTLARSAFEIKRT
jgi:hypothetical protein